MQDNDISVRIGDFQGPANPMILPGANDRNPRGLHRGERRVNIIDRQRQTRSAAGGHPARAAVQRERDVTAVVLRPLVFWAEQLLPEPEHVAVEMRRRRQVGDREHHEIGAADSHDGKEAVDAQEPARRVAGCPVKAHVDG